MKTIITFIILFFWTSLSSVEAQFMQNRGMNAPGIHQIIIQHGEDLNLSDEQIVQLIELQYEQRAEARTTRRDARVRGDMRSQRRGTPQTRAYRAPRAETRASTVWYRERYSEQIEKIFDILSEEQISELQSIRLDYVERQHEYSTLRNQIFVEKAEIDSEKAGDVLELLNQISEQRKQMQTERIENPGEWDEDAMRNHFAEIRSVQNNLRNLLTIAEYESLMSTGVIGRQGHRGNMASGRTFMRRR